jgi:hypothetical protein
MKTHSTKIPAIAVLVSALLACSSKPPTDARVERFASLPKWDGLWVAEGMQAGINGLFLPDAPPPQQLVKLAGFEAPWNDAGRAKFGAVSAAAPHGKAAGWGYPMMMNSFAPMQFIITPEETLILNTYRDVRHVYTDGRPHPAEEDRWPTVWGDSIGHWEGDTLVIETVSVQNPPDYFFRAPPLSEKARYVERLGMTARDRIDSDITIEDPATLTQPWKVKIVYQRPEGIDRLIHDAYTNDRTGFDGELLTIEPPKP